MKCQCKCGVVVKVDSWRQFILARHPKGCVTIPNTDIKKHLLQLPKEGK